MVRVRHLIDLRVILVLGRRASTSIVSIHDNVGTRMTMPAFMPTGMPNMELETGAILDMVAHPGAKNA